MIDDYGILDLLPLLIAGIGGVGRGWRFPMDNDEEELSGGPSGDGLLLEVGPGYLLLEDGNYLLLE
jgi:hypothetical protein